MFYQVAPEIVPFSFDSGALKQGEFAQIMCAVKNGDRPLTLTWSLKGGSIASDDSITTTMLGERTSVLMISYVDYQHRGNYTCKVTNPAGSSTHSAELLVKGKIM